MKKRNIIIVEIFSAGTNYIHDIRKMGHNPISLELYHPKEKRKEIRKILDKIYSLNHEEPPQILEGDKSYEKTLEKVKELNPLAILPGSDDGIIWATRLAHDLGLRGNDPKNLKKMIDKKYAQDALKKANIRHIKSQFVSSFDEAKEFVSKLDKLEVVVKPSVGQGTIGVCICKNEDELKDAFAFNEDLSFDIDLNEDTKMIIQEYIGGKEYVVNTVCCEGHNRPISAYSYEKIEIEGRGAIYDYDMAIDETHPHFKELEEYNEKVISALDLKYGVVHGEYKLDENGPVLIEMNCRIPGPFQKHTLLDKVWGHHSTALSLESYINPEECIKKSDRPLKLLTYFIIKSIIIYEGIDVIKQTFDEAFKDSESYMYGASLGDNRTYSKTIDLLTSGGNVFLVNSDKNKLMEDLNTIRRMEKFEIEKIYKIKKFHKRIRSRKSKRH